MGVGHFCETKRNADTSVRFSPALLIPAVVSLRYLRALCGEKLFSACSAKFSAPSAFQGFSPPT